jgi:signal transduction histidine kinase
MMNRRLFLAILLPFIACAVQWVLWDAWIKPYVWFLFFPAAFFSAWLGGLRGGLAGTVVGALLAWYVYIPPQFSFVLHDPAGGASIALFVIMGGLFAWFFERLTQAMRRTEEAKAEITQLYNKTLELDELKSQFFANVSHELRTPLTLIMAPLEQKLRRPASADFSIEDRREAEMMLRNARLLYRHVSDLLDAAKLEAGGMRVDYARLDLAALVRALASHFDSVAREHNIAYRVAVPPVLMAEVDGEKIQRILLNLLSNAFKFTPDGGAIVVRLHEDAGQAVIEVEDNGPGVPAEMRAAVFERFRQVEGGASRQHGGTGLGLAIVKEFAELHGGAASVTEAPGGGALFAVRLPLSAPAAAVIHAAPGQIDAQIDRQAVEALDRPAAPVATADVPATHEAPLVLVVEDNADMNEFIAATLRPHYRVASARDGRAGLEKAQALAPDLILADVMMPVMSGDAMVLELRRLPDLADVPIVMLTAKADDELRVKLLKAGVQDYLAKPFNVEELLARVGGLLAERRRTVDALTLSAAALKEAQHLASIGNWRWDLRTDRHVWSEEVYRIYGRDPALPPAVYPEVQQYFTPASWVRLSAAVEQGLTHGVAYECDAEVVRPDGSHAWITARGHARRDAAGAVVEMFGTVQDITMRKRAEDEIRLLNADLERRVIERTAELTAANQDLDAFAYAVSHDLRAPLRAMNGFALALTEDYGDKMTGEAQSYLDQIGIASRKMGELIDGILVLSRSTRGELLRDPVDLSALARRLLDDLSRENPARQVAVEIEADLQVRGDGRMIEAALGNLLGNAWKYTGQVGDPRIRVYSEVRDGVRRICVADNGAGFDMAHAERLFKPFQRLHRQDEFPGIGIGLATVQRIVNRHGGRIEARGAPGRGATFCFTLPALIPEENMP